LRVPDHPITLALLAELDEPLLSMTLIMPGETMPMHEADTIREELEHQLDLIVDAGACGIEPTTVIDLTHGEPQLMRAGRGALSPFGLD
jgi:tRNA A37 threonylcarbamoyladenosine synthetase subunit TsaC/SUA5/YrdC